MDDHDADGRTAAAGGGGGGGDGSDDGGAGVRSAHSSPSRGRRKLTWLRKVKYTDIAKFAGHLPHRYVSYGITQYYLPPSRGDIPAFTPAEAGTRLSDPGRMQG